MYFSMPNLAAKLFHSTTTQGPPRHTTDGAILALLDIQSTNKTLISHNQRPVHPERSPNDMTLVHAGYSVYEKEALLARSATSTLKLLSTDVHIGSETCIQYQYNKEYIIVSNIIAIKEVSLQFFVVQARNSQTCITEEQ